MKLEVRPAEGKAATDVAYTSTQASSHGAMAFVFGGKGKDGKPFATGRYEARLMFIGDDGQTKQTETLVFVHDTPEAQSARYAEVQGKLDLSRDGSGPANAEVDLVDERGNVVQSVRSNASGQYRLRASTRASTRCACARKASRLRRPRSTRRPEHLPPPRLCRCTERLPCASCRG